MKGRNQKLKLLYLSKIMQEETDDTHALTMPEIIEKLAKYGVEAKRKSIYDDLDALDYYGMEIIREHSGYKTYYHCGNREFEIAEIKFLVDAIQSSKFISEKKTKELIKKLEKTISIYDAKLLDREIKVAGRVKNMNESIYYSIDTIHNAIIENKAISFKYFSWNVKGEEEFRRDGNPYNVSPWALHFDDERYYLIGYDHDKEEIRHYRVDKMRQVSITEMNRKGKKEFSWQNQTKYNERYFRMYGGEIQNVSLRCQNEMANIIIDQFGKDVRLRPSDEGYFTVKVDVAVSNQFLSWVIALGGKVKIEKPDNVKEQMQKLLDNTFVV
ncbi:MAG: WYL domain-containing protein [Eubacterium sp.]|nr:WYL domain-containing protein [Eubacterium sp.]